MLFNRFVVVRFVKAGFVIGGKQFFDKGQLSIPVSIEFECKHTTESTANEATIKIYNAAPETQKKLFVEGALIELEAGYWPDNGPRDTGIIYKGQIRTVTTQVEDGIEVVSTINCGDGDDAISKRRTRRKHAKGTTHKDVVTALVGDMAEDGIKVGKIEVPDFAEPRARTIDRPTARELTDIAVQHDLQWSIQDGTLNMYPSDQPLRDKPLVLGPESGVIDTPEFTHEGVNVRTLMIPSLRPGHTIVLENRFVKSRASETLKIEEITFRGGNVGDDFGAEIVTKFVTKGSGKPKVKRARDRLAGNRV